MDRIVTILTPTYNRSSELKRLYNSLQNQTVHSFIWLIVDDGSTDDTQSTVGTFSDSQFDIQYIKKENGGKHRALNLGIKHICTPMTFIVDSDDWLDMNAISEVVKCYNKYRDTEKIAGFSFLRSFPDGKTNGAAFKKDDFIGNYINVRIFGNDTNADKAEVFYTDVLKQYPFPEFQGEKFLGEDIIWIKIAEKYDMLYINSCVYIGDYQADGLTKNRRKNNIASPVGCYERSKEFLKHSLPLKVKIKNILQLIIYGRFRGYHLREVYLDTRMIQVIILYPIGIALYLKWKKENK